MKRVLKEAGGITMVEEVPDATDTLAREIADSYAPELITNHCDLVETDGEAWLDLDSDGLPGVPVRELAETEIKYCEARKMLRHHPTRPNLVQIVEE
jgi:hypothetical protein